LLLLLNNQHLLLPQDRQDPQIQQFWSGHIMAKWQTNLPPKHNREALSTGDAVLLNAA